MLKFSLFKRVEHQSFKYIPRYYDPEKEALQERLSRYETLANDEKSTTLSKERIKAGLRSRYGGDASYRKRMIRQSNFRLVIIIAILVIICFLILSSSKIDGILGLLMSK